MTGDAGDARTEAERIVEVFHLAGFPDREPDVIVPGLRDALVAALAAAIEEDEAERAVEALRGNPRHSRLLAMLPRLSNARTARHAALSALRARAGEET